MIPGSSLRVLRANNKRIFHLGADVFQAVGELDGVLLLVLVEHLQLDVQLLRLFELLRREGRRQADELENEDTQRAVS